MSRDETSSGDRSKPGLSRRALLTGWFTSAREAAARADDAPAPQRQAPPARTDRLVYDLLRHPRDILADHEAMTRFGPRLPGSAAHRDFVSWLAQELQL